MENDEDQGRWRLTPAGLVKAWLLHATNAVEQTQPNASPDAKAALLTEMIRAATAVHASDLQREKLEFDMARSEVIRVEKARALEAKATAKAAKAAKRR